MRGPGKIFEQNFANSAPSYALAYRVPDNPSGFQKNSMLRFTRQNPFDYLIWDSRHFRLYALELKTVAGKSIEFEREGDKKGSGIHYHQALGLNDWDKYPGIISGFIIEFRAMELTIFIHIKDYNKLIECVPKKSFTVKDLDDYDIPYQVIPQKIMRVNFKYDIDHFLSEQSK